MIATPKTTFSAGPATPELPAKPTVPHFLCPPPPPTYGRSQSFDLTMEYLHGNRKTSELEAFDFIGILQQVSEMTINPDLDSSMEDEEVYDEHFEDMALEDERTKTPFVCQTPVEELYQETTVAGCGYQRRSLVAAHQKRKPSFLFSPSHSHNCENSQLATPSEGSIHQTPQTLRNYLRKKSRMDFIGHSNLILNAPRLPASPDLSVDGGCFARNHEPQFSPVTHKIQPRLPAFPLPSLRQERVGHCLSLLPASDLPHRLTAGRRQGPPPPPMPFIGESPVQNESRLLDANNPRVLRMRKADSTHLRFD